MKHKYQISVSQSLNPIFGFGWFTGSSLQNKVLTIGNQSYDLEIISADKKIES